MILSFHELHALIAARIAQDPRKKTLGLGVTAQLLSFHEDDQVMTGHHVILADVVVPETVGRSIQDAFFAVLAVKTHVDDAEFYIELPQQEYNTVTTVNDANRKQMNFVLVKDKDKLTAFIPPAPIPIRRRVALKVVK